MTAMALQAQGPASFPQERATPPPSYSTASASPRSLSVAPRRTTRGAFRPLSCPTLGGAGPATFTAVHHYHEGPDFSLRIDPAFRTLPYSSIYLSGSSAPSWRHEHPLRGRNEISPGQTLLCPSVLPAHTLSRSALRRYFLRRKAASSDQRTHGRPVRHGFRLGCGPEVRRRPFRFHLTMDTLPSSRLAPRGRRVPPGLLSTHPCPSPKPRPADQGLILQLSGAAGIASRPRSPRALGPGRPGSRAPATRPGFPPSWAQRPVSPRSP
jgi:hypothetical protein